MSETAAPTGPERHLSTAHLRRDLGRRSVRGGIVTVTAQIVKIVIQLAALVVLARLLSPTEFGLYAIAAVLMTLFEMFKDLGLSLATVQRAEISQRQVSTLFWLNVLLGALIAGVTAALGPLAGQLYGEPALSEILYWLAGSFLLTGVGTQHQALLRRQMRFGALAVLQTAAEVAALAAAVAAAVAGLGFWALVVQRLVWALLMGPGAWAVCGWRPGRPGPFREVAHLVRFGGEVTASMLVNQLASNADKLLLGWMWGPAPVGLYERAQKLVRVALHNLNTPLFGVAVPALSRLKDEPETYRRAYLGVVGKLSMLTTPVAAVLVACPDWVVALLFGQAWLAAAPLLGWFAVITLYAPVSITMNWLFISQGRTAEMLHAGLANAALTLLALACGLPFGVEGVAAASVVGGVALRVPLMLWLAGRTGPVGRRDLLGVLWPTTGTAVLAALAVASARTWTPLAGFGALEGLLAAGALSTLIALACFASLPSTRPAVRAGLGLPARLLRGGALRGGSGA